MIPAARIPRILTPTNLKQIFASKQATPVRLSATLTKNSFSHNNGKILVPLRNGKSVELLNVVRSSAGVRYGSGGRGTLPHPTEPIAVIGPACQLDTREVGWANELLITLDPEMRHQLFDALRDYESMVWSPGDEVSKKDAGKRLSNKELRQLALFSGLPFVGFGTLDNLIMISAGEYIDATFGVMLGISTMAAAGFGNMLSDVVGLGTAGYVENLARKIGISPPHMSPSQFDLTSTKLVSNLGRVVGVLIGCCIGMCPLLFVNREKESEDESESPATPSASEKVAQPSSNK